MGNQVCCGHDNTGKTSFILESDPQKTKHQAKKVNADQFTTETRGYNDENREERIEADAIIQVSGKLTDFMRDLEEGYPEHFSKYAFGEYETNEPFDFLLQPQIHLKNIRTLTYK